MSCAAHSLGDPGLAAFHMRPLSMYRFDIHGLCLSSLLFQGKATVSGQTAMFDGNCYDSISKNRNYVADETHPSAHPVC
jgi:hypothetical protein